jgi:glutathione S-transferase
MQAFKTNADSLLRRFEGELQEGGKPYLLGSDPTVADFFLFEALGVYESAFGSATVQQLFPTLVSPPRWVFVIISYY